MPTSAQIRAIARGSLSGSWAKGVIVGLIYSVIAGLVSSIPYIGWIGAILLAGPLILGVYMFFVRLGRGEQPSVATMFDGFNRFVPAFQLYVLIQVFVLLWSLLLIIPGIIASLRYSQAFFIMQDDPHISATDALNASKEMMIGHKGRLFVLHLSFIGWALLCVLTFGIGFLWLYPYILASQAAFYQDLKSRANG